MSLLLWMRVGDLRLRDNPALVAAAREEKPVVPVFLWTPELGLGAASRWWLHFSLERLDEELKECGSRLILRRGEESVALLKELIDESQAEALHANAASDPRAQAIEHELRASFPRLRVELHPSHSRLWPENSLKTQTGKSFSVFTPFWKAALKAPPPDKPWPRPRAWKHPKKFPRSEALSALKLLPEISWDRGLREKWQPGEEAAEKRWKNFLAKKRLAPYLRARDLPAEEGSTLLSPHLAFGEISPRQLWWEVEKKAGGVDLRRELAWRDFAKEVLREFPHSMERPLRPDFLRMPWRKDAVGLKTWQQGQTGYPIVDAGMRELWITGWMHNRVRMIVASFLVKDLLIDWREGAAWFWETLVDADRASNTLNWQWVAGSGVDAAPFFRIFHPVLQGRKFDPEGAYVRRWVPELSALPNKYLHAPWEAPEEVLRRAGIELGRDYPPPYVDHAEARARALTALRSLRH